MARIGNDFWAHSAKPNTVRRRAGAPISQLKLYDCFTNHSQWSSRTSQIDLRAAQMSFRCTVNDTTLIVDRTPLQLQTRPCYVRNGGAIASVVTTLAFDRSGVVRSCKNIHNTMPTLFTC